MSNYQLRKPLIQAGAVLATFLIFFLFVSSAHPTGFFEGLGAVIVGTFKSILFIIGLSIGLTVTIGALVAIFFAALFLYSPELTSRIYKEFKERLFETIDECKDCCTCQCSDKRPSTRIPVEKLEELQKSLQTATSQKLTLQKSVDSLKMQVQTANNEISKVKSSLNDETAAKDELNAELLAAMESISELTGKLESQEATSKSLAEEKTALTAKASELEAQAKEFEEKVKELEEELDKAPEAGIFSYMESEEDKDLFVEKIDEALEQEMTYALIDTFLTEELSADLDQIIKDHPSLTKNYIRNKRRELENN